MVDPKPEKRTTKSYICKVCKNTYYKEKTKTFVKWCSDECCSELSKKVVADQRKKRLIDDKKRRTIERNKLKTVTDHCSELETLFNKIIRTIDSGLPCIARPECLYDDNANKWDAGHYYSKGSCISLRFWAHNVHRQSKYSNNERGGEPLLYRVGLVNRYGEQYVDDIEIARQVYNKLGWKIPDIEYAKTQCRLIIKELNKGKAITRDEINLRLKLYDVNLLHSSKNNI